jgi:hypothetical protein
MAPLAFRAGVGEKKAMKGRGTDAAPPNRYERMHVELEHDDDNPPPEKVATVYYRDASRTILAENRSPDIPFRWSLNPYRGCYMDVLLYARPSRSWASTPASTRDAHHGGRRARALQNTFLLAAGPDMVSLLATPTATSPSRSPALRGASRCCRVPEPGRHHHRRRSSRDV